ncbi:oligosaccharide flippase family protein [Candidatus Uhrbacteria bacterium]|nr:oligosaccharide flippase family protein [Candidatus Uhrbacteria bacterium]
MSTTRAIAWNTGAQAAGKVISTIFGVIIIALMTRYLGQVGFGYYSTANAFFQIFAILLDLGINVMIVQMLGEHKGNAKYEKRAVSATMTFRLLTAFILLGIAPFIGLLFPYAFEVKLIMFALWVSFFAATLNQVVIGVQQRHLKMHIVAIAEVAGRAILLVGLLLAVFLNLGLLTIVVFVSVGSVVNLIINWWVARSYASFAWNWDPKFWKELLSRSWPIGISIFFNLAYFKSDAFILSLVRPASEVGIYSAAYRVLEIAVTFPFMLAGIMLPLMAHAWAKKNQAKFAKYLSQSYSAMLLFAMPLVAGVLVLGTETIVFISGSEFAVSGDILKILSLAVFMIYFGTISSHVVVAINKQKAMLPAYAVVAIITVILYVIYIPIYGMWAAAWLTVFSETAIALAATWFAYRSAPGIFSLMTIAKILFASLVMALAILPLKQLWLPIPIISGMVIYAVMIYVTGAISKDTIKEIMNVRKVAGPTSES